MTSKIRVTVLGATGSIGVSTLDVINRHRDRFEVFALTAHRQIDALYEQCVTWRPRYAVLACPDSAEQLAPRLARAGIETEVLGGAAALSDVASMAQTDYVMAAIVGAAGLLPTLEAARAGKRVLLANKEALVMSGQLFMDTIKDHGAELLPIDSEHNAIFQALPEAWTPGLDGAGIARILLTASGGPFRSMPLDEFAAVTPDAACAHPTWEMGRKISVDSATMMNKGLEIIEAAWLFGLDESRIEVVIHPQSVIHSLVEYVDGSQLAQLGSPDMRTPIAYSLAYPERMESGTARLDLFAIKQLDFEPPSVERFPCLGLARAALRAGGTTTTILNAANEIAVAAFLDAKLGFDRIPHLIEGVLQRLSSRSADSIEIILADDAQARIEAHEFLAHESRAKVNQAVCP